MKRLGIIVVLLGILIGGLCLGVRWAKKERLPEGEEVKGITCKRVRALAIDKKETLWIGTDEGLLSFDGKRWKLFDIVNSSIPDNNVTSVFIDKDNNKWITTRTKGVGRFDGQEWEIYNTTNSGLVENSVKEILQDKNGNMWFLTWRVTRFDGEEWITYTEEDGFTARNLDSMVQDRKGNIWVSTDYSKYIFRYDGSKWIGYKKEEFGLPKLITLRIYDVDKDGRIWCTIWLPKEANRVVIFDSEGFFKLDLKGSGLTKDSRITRVYIDPRDNKWIAYESKYGGGGVSGAVKFNGTKWTSYAIGTPLEKQRIQAIVMDGEGSMWFGTLDKLLKFDGKEWTAFEAIDITKKRLWWRHAERDKIDSMPAIEVPLKELRRKPRKYYGKKVRTTGYYYSGYLSVKKIPDIGIGIEFKVKDEDKQYISPRKMTVEGFFESGREYPIDWGGYPYVLFVTDIIPTKKG